VKERIKSKTGVIGGRGRCVKESPISNILWVLVSVAVQRPCGSLCSTHRLEVFLCEGELDCRGIRRVARITNCLGQNVGSTEIGSDARAKLTLRTGQVLASLNGVADVGVDRGPVWTTIHGTSAEECQGVILCTGIVDNDVPHGCLVELLRKVNIDAQEVGIHLCSLDLLEQALEPSERGSVTADPEKFDTPEGTKSTALLPVPNVLKDGSERSDTDTGTDEDGDFGFEDVFSWSTVWTINTNNGERARVGIGVELNKVTTTFLDQVRLVILLKGLHGSCRNGLDNGRSGTDTLAESLGPVTDLTDMNRHVGVFGGRSDRERMPLEVGYIGDLKEQPLAGGVLERWLDDAEFHSAGGVDEDLGELSRTAGADLPPDTLEEVDDTGPDDVAPREIANADIRVVEREGAGERWQSGTADEASSGVRVDADHEEERQVVSVPERLETLLANFCVGSTVHEDHDEQHDMASDAARLAVVDVEGISRTELTPLHIDEVDVVGGSVNHRPKGQRVGDLTVEPYVLIGGKKPREFWSDYTNNVSQHRDEDEATIIGEDEACASRGPDRDLEGVEARKFRVGCLRIPSIGEEEQVGTVKEDVEGETSWSQKLSSKPLGDAHCNISDGLLIHCKLLDAE